MKKNSIMQLQKIISKFLILTTIIISAVASSLLLTGCSAGFHYDNSDKYSIGNGTVIDIVKAIDISWLSGDLELDFSGNPSDGIVFSETSNKELNDNLKLHYWLDGTTLRLKYAASGKINFNGITKKLKVTVPSDVTLTELKIDSVSSNIKIDGARSDSVFAAAVSGNISANDLRASEEVSLSSTSGNIDGSILTACKKLSASSTSGSIAFSTEARIRELLVETVSGNILLSNLNPAKEAIIDTVSGNVDLEFLDNSGFELTLDTVSGDIHSDLNMFVSGSKYVYGTADSDFKVKTVSGDLRISRAPA